MCHGIGFSRVFDIARPFVSVCVFVQCRRIARVKSDGDALQPGMRRHPNGHRNGDPRPDSDGCRFFDLLEIRLAVNASGTKIVQPLFTKLNE